jgi:hypothetical protein
MTTLRLSLTASSELRLAREERRKAQEQAEARGDAASASSLL